MVAKLGEIRNLLIDMDGVLYRGQTPLAGAAELIRFLKECGIRFLLVTNNSTLTPAQFAERMQKMGIPVEAGEIMTSAVATAEYLATIAPPGTKVNVIGEGGLIAELEKRGFAMAGREAQFVVCGLDKTVTYEKLKTATLAIRDGAIFIGTNADKTYPLEKDLIPGAGSILAALIAATDVQPIIVGKPEPVIIEQCLRLLGAAKEETALLGDRLDTDILGGHRAGITTIMVTTGIHTAEEANKYPFPPNYLFPGLPALLAAWRQALGEQPR